VSGTKNGDVLTATYTTTATAGSAVGNYDIVPALSGTAIDNYNVTVQHGRLTVTKASLTVTPASVARKYGEANPTLTGIVSGVVSGDVITAKYATTAAPASAAGTYPITATLVDDGNKAGNYAVSLGEGTLTVSKASLSVTAADASRKYGEGNPTLTGSLLGVVNGDAITATYSTAATQASGIGTYDITPQLADPDKKLGNYEVTSGKGTLTITKAALSVKADDKSRAYGDANPALTGSLSGIKNSDAISATYGTEATQASGVGSYPIVPAIADPDKKLANYELTSTNGALTVTKTLLSAKANDATKVYGDVNPAFSGTVTGIKNNDAITATYASAADKTTGVGSAAIVPTINAASTVLANYQTPTITNGTLTITAAPLSVKANDATKVYGDANPSFSGEIIGIKNGDPLKATYVSAATATSDVGTAPIVPAIDAAAAVLGNYQTPTLTNGTLTIAKALLTITPANTTKTFGEVASLTGVITGQKNGDSFTATYASAGSVAEAPVGTGTYPITVTGVAGAKLGNYTEDRKTAILTVNKATTTITLSDLVKAYKAGTGQSPTVTAPSVIGGQVAVKLEFYQDASVGSPLVGTGSVTNVGVYKVVATVNDANYAGAPVDGLFVIFDASGGFVTGGGWINSPAGALLADTRMTGKAHFGFVSKYQKGANVPTGETEFQFQAGDFRFKSTSYEWLTVAGARAQYKGVGTVNGSAGYSFLLTAIDGQINGGGNTDKFRIKVWNTVTNAIVYDNQIDSGDTADPTTVIGGGSIQIQSK
jgi:hypothetical protein